MARERSIGRPFGLKLLDSSAPCHARLHNSLDARAFMEYADEMPDDQPLSEEEVEYAMQQALVPALQPNQLQNPFIAEFGDAQLDGRFTNAVCEDIDMLLQTGGAEQHEGGEE